MHRQHRDRHTAGSGQAGGRPGNRIRPGVAALIAAVGLAATALAAVPASAMASAAAPPAAGRDTAAVRAAGHRATPPAPLSAQRPLSAPQAPKLPGVSRVCPVPARAGQMECLSLIRTSTGHRLGVARDQAVS
ncbi:MAG TPA: hypothetical protein VG123_30040, partial [Streptosporangiaceae bacterium]|nr:hypothetical protein [Streptosporangiaceae bacterium]